MHADTLAGILFLSIIVSTTDGQVQPINEVIADTLRQTIDVFLTNRPLAGSDPREGLIKLACIPCKLALMLVRLSTQNVPGIGPLTTGLCTFVIGDQQTCNDQVGFITLALEFADNTQGCERFWACARPPDDTKKKDSSNIRHSPGHREFDLPEDAILLTLPSDANDTSIDIETTPSSRQITPAPKRILTPARPGLVSSAIGTATGLAGTAFNTFTGLLGGGRRQSGIQRSDQGLIPDYRPGFGANVGFGVYTSPLLDYIGKKK